MSRTSTIAIEGAPATGKTTTVYGVAAIFKSRGLIVEISEESGRNALVEDVVLHHAPATMEIELQLFSETIARQIMSARTADLVICDKTPATLISFSWMLLGDRLSEEDQNLLTKMEELCALYWKRYAKVFLLSDLYDTDNDPIRENVIGRRHEFGTLLREYLDRFHLPYVEVPKGLELADRAGWIAERVT